MTVSEAEHRISEFSALMHHQLNLIEHLKRRGEDATSDEIIAESLRASLFFLVQSCHRARKAARQKDSFTEGGRFHLVEKIEAPTKMSTRVSETGCEQQKEFSTFNFQPLSEIEKNELAAFLEAKGKRGLGKLVDRGVRGVAGSAA